MQVEEQILHGSWWVASNSKLRVCGALEIQSSGESEIILHFDDLINMEGFFSSEDIDTTEKPFTCKRLIGLLYDGKFVIAEDVSCAQKETTNKTINRFDCFPSYICISHINFYKDNLKLSNISLEIDGIDNFINITGYEPNVDTSDLPQLFETISELPSEINLFNKGNISLCVQFNPNYKQNFSELSIKQTAKFQLTSKNPIPFLDWQDKISSLNYFLCIVFAQTIALKSIQCIKKIDGQDETLNIIAYSDPEHTAQHSKPSLAEPLFNYSECKNEIGSIIHEFMELREQHIRIFQAFFSSFLDDQYMENRSFMIIAALEGFHRQIRCNNNERRKRLTLRKRIHELFTEFEQLSKYQYQWEDTINKTVSYRNQEAHLDDSEESYSDDDIHKITKTLHVVFAILFLAEAAKRANFTIPPEWLNRNSWISQNLPKKRLISPKNHQQKKADKT